MAHESAPPSPAIEDFTFDDAPPSFGSADNGHPDPEWVWVLVRASNDPRQEVWVRFAAEGAPNGIRVARASVPVPGDAGVRVVSEISGTTRVPSQASEQAVRADLAELWTVVGALVETLRGNRRRAAKRSSTVAKRNAQFVCAGEAVPEGVLTAVRHRLKSR
jgi:hypothetical protein